MYDRDVEAGGDWQLFGGQLRDLAVQSTFADLQGHVLQNSWHDGSAGEMLYHRSDADVLEDAAWNYSVDVIDAKPPSSQKGLEGPSLYEEDLYDLLSSSPEEALLPVDDDGALVNVASTMDNSFNFIVQSYSGECGLGEAKFDCGTLLSGQQYLIANVPQNLSENLKIQFEKSHDLVEVDKAVRTRSFAYECDNALDSLHYENHYKPAAELDGIECVNDSLLDSENVCNILKQLIANHFDPHSCKSDLLSVSPEEVESVLSGDSAPRVVEDYDSVIVPCTPPASSVGFLQFSDVTVSTAAFLSTEYSQDSLSSSSTSRSHTTSSPCVPYPVEARADRKLKKKEQNKTAALRYRNKKREEKGVVYSEVEELEQKNAQLQNRADDLTKEINYLKGLLEEIKRQ